MTKTKQKSFCSYEITERTKGELTIHFIGRMDIETSPPVLKEMLVLIREKSPFSVIADLERVTYFDDFGSLVLFEIKQFMTAQKGKFDIVNISGKAEKILSQTDFNSDELCTPLKRKRAFNLIIHLGESVIKDASGIKFMVSFIGSVMISSVRVCFHPKSLRVNDTITHMERTGVDALPIVALISFLLGLIMAFMSSIQFRQFGASIYVASLVAFAMVSELGPIMTAIVVAGRSGSAFAAEIGTMKISEEIDALSTMGFDPILFLTVPRLIASVIVVPLLILFSNLFAISGGLMVGVFMLDLSPNTYIKGTIEALTLTEVLWGMMKGAVFAMLIAWVGCLRGFQAEGGASAVGSAATSAVVTSIFLIILFDSVFAVTRSYWG
ncbi:MlaE family lipid ABC transporter permease subunit [Desulfonema magnum]|uniref:ABC transport system, permease protein, STAS domain-containing n=1 Tax=Desulfonema magnum TaxID=45655 RepID=A0A975BRX7_9BACT|nr:MlaE family lipid ABC transporter permease subunit [Desulfonema magnum]QTA90099.1 putative ABC transport system, permease protein, STAS domain-containing [Desulfonema magnum]